MTHEPSASSQAAAPLRTITFVGGGNMATALMGALAAGASPVQFHVVEPFAAQRERLAARFAFAHLHEAIGADAVAGTDLVVLAVKPQQMRAAAQALARFVAEVPVVLSIAAGIRTLDLARWLGGYRRIVRAMPNTPALIARGISGLYADPAVDAAARAAAAQVLRAAGEVVWCEHEPALDAVTGISGSGPAYVFFLLEALERAGVDQGFDAATARRLAYATFAGAVALAQASSDEPSALRANVTSKGGTTERGLAVLSERAVDQALREAVAAATARARELGDEFGAGG
jgi:pyrroline-5-carboxylate reductase